MIIPSSYAFHGKMPWRRYKDTTHRRGWSVAAAKDDSVWLDHPGRAAAAQSASQVTQPYGAVFSDVESHYHTASLCRCTPERLREKNCLRVPIGGGTVLGECVILVSILGCRVCLQGDQASWNYVRELAIHGRAISGEWLSEGQNLGVEGSTGHGRAGFRDCTLCRLEGYTDEVRKNSLMLLG
jgi:hypothetical protein